jgi:hypothetical protein
MINIIKLPIHYKVTLLSPENTVKRGWRILEDD